MEIELPPGKHLDDLFERSEAAGQGDKAIGQHSHQRFALVHGIDDVQLGQAAVRDLLLLQRLRDHADDLATELQQVYALQGEATRAREAEERARARLVELVQTARANAEKTAAIRDDMAELEAGARRLQDAVWSLDPALLAVERFAADAGRVGTEQRPLEEELVELEARASATLEEVRGLLLRDLESRARTAALRESIAALRERYEVRL